MKLPGVQDVSIKSTTVKCTIVGSPDALIKAAAAHEITGLKSQESSLEDVFLNFYDGSEPYDA